MGARLTGDGSPGPLFTVQTSGNDAWEESELTVLFGPGYVRAMRLARRPLLGWVGLIWLGNFVVTILMRYAIRHGWRATVTLANTLGPGRAKADPDDVLANVGAVANLSRKSPTVLIGNWEHALGVGRPWPATGHQEVWIISPSAEDSLHREVADLRSSGAQVHVISPSPASREALPSGFGSLDPVRRLAAARAGYEDGRAAAAAARALGLRRPL